MSVAVLIPVLNRPARVAPLLESLRSSQVAIPLRPYFLLSPGDDEEARVVSASGADHTIVPWEPGPGDFSRKTNLGIRLTSEPWILAGADDLAFTKGWADEAIRVSTASGKRFVATNDDGNPLVQKGQHATHPLVARSYIEEYGTWDGDGLYAECYHHVYVDNEASDTAKQRNEFVAAPDSHVTHLHWIWRKSAKDDTYRKGDEHQREDHALYMSRRRQFASSR